MIGGLSETRFCEMQDKRVTFDEWGPMKGSTPFGQLPCLEVDGKYLAQSAAIGKQAGIKQHVGILQSQTVCLT